MRAANQDTHRWEATSACCLAQWKASHPPSLPPAPCSALLGQWRDRYAPGEVAEKVKHFFK